LNDQKKDEYVLPEHPSAKDSNYGFMIKVPDPAAQRSQYGKLSKANEIQLIEDMGWYFGNMERKAAEDILNAQGRDCYLARSSSIQGCYAISYRSKEWGLNHTLVERTEKGYKFQDEPPVFENIYALLKSSSKLLSLVPVYKAQSDSSGKGGISSTRMTSM